MEMAARPSAGVSSYVNNPCSLWWLTISRKMRKGGLLLRRLSPGITTSAPVDTIITSSGFASYSRKVNQFGPRSKVRSKRFESSESRTARCYNMAPPHRSLGHWSKDVIRQLKPSAKKPGEEQTKDAGRSADLENPADLTANVEQLDNNASGNCVSATQTLTPTNADSESGNEAVRVAGDLGAANVVDKVGECQAPTTAENVSGAVPPAHPETSQIPPRDEKSPIWSKSIARFENEKPEEYKLMMRQLEEITNLKDLDTWDTWLNRQGLDNGSKETKYKWLRICKAYMPSVATVRVLALGFSSLDPHKVAPLVVTGVFVLAEVGHGGSHAVWVIILH